MPPAAETPIVMVGAGTGLAPFRGFLQERSLLREGGTQLGEAMLFFGCTRRDCDFICEAELSEHLESGALSELVTAFSREVPTKKTYVQHRVAERAEAVLRIVKDRCGHFYVCGSTAMGRAVKEALVGVLAQQMPRGEAERFVAEMEKEGRFVAELWA